MPEVLIIIGLFIFVILGVAYLIFSRNIGGHVPTDLPSRAERIGQRGEMRVQRALGEDIDGVQYLINDITLTDDNGQTSQIDHVFVNENGIWVIETKTYSGMIFGSENNSHWTQVLAYGHEKNTFYNPLKQNNTHLYRLGKQLKPSIKLHSVIVFASPDVDIKNVSASGVCRVKNLYKYVSQKTDIHLTPDKITHYRNCLIALKCSNQVSKEEHIENIHKMQENLENDICPRCGGKLREVEGKYGTFKGCSNYPKCTFTLKSR